MCDHIPTCPAASARRRFTACVLVRYPEQGWSRLCNGLIVFDDGGALLPDGEAIAPATLAA
jgi:hypothetical protein